MTINDKQTQFCKVIAESKLFKNDKRNVSRKSSKV